MRRSILCAVFAGTLSLLLVPQARANEKDNVINHIAEAMAAAKVCGRLKANSAFIAVAAAYYGIKPKDIAAGGKYHRKLVDLIRKKHAALSEYDEDVVCLSGEFLYGEDGINVPNLLIPADDADETIRGPQ